MKKREIVKSNILFNDIINKGKKISNKCFIISTISTEEEKPKFGIAVGKKIGNAVTRNYYKRIIRNIITKNKKIFPNFHNYIVICKKEVLNLSYQEIEKEILNLMKIGDSNEE